MVKCKNLAENIDYEATISREKFESLCQDLFDKCLKTVNEVKISVYHIDIVLCGGSSRIPKLQFMLSKMLNGKELNKRIDPDLAVSIGATLRAAKL